MRGVRDEEKRDRVLALLQGGMNVVDAARAADCPRRTIYNWAQSGDEEIAAALPSGRQAEEQHPEFEARMLDALAAIAEDPQADAAVRVRAAEAVLKRCVPAAAAQGPAAPTDAQEKPGPPPADLTPEEAAARFRPLT